MHQAAPADVAPVMDAWVKPVLVLVQLGVRKRCGLLRRDLAWWREGRLGVEPSLGGMTTTMRFTGLWEPRLVFSIVAELLRSDDRPLTVEARTLATPPGSPYTLGTRVCAGATRGEGWTRLFLAVLRGALNGASQSKANTKLWASAQESSSRRMDGNMAR